VLFTGISIQTLIRLTSYRLTPLRHVRRLSHELVTLFWHRGPNSLFVRHKHISLQHFRGFCTFNDRFFSRSKSLVWHKNVYLLFSALTISHLRVFILKLFLFRPLNVLLSALYTIRPAVNLKFGRASCSMRRAPIGIMCAVGT